MKTRHRAFFACVATVSLVASPGLAPTANAQDRAPTSTEIAVNSTYGLLDNPITAPIGLFILLSSMTWHYFLWCPIGQSSGFIDPYSGECTF